jgi:hypothetical protein
MAAVRNNGVPLVMQAPQANITQSVIGLTNSLFHVAGPENVVEVAAGGAKKQWMGFLSRK